MEISVIASGSNGNCCLIENNGTSVLIDAGKSGKEIEHRANRLGKSLDNLDAILITHAHHDHISGAGVLSRRFDVPLYMTSEVCSDSGFKLGNIRKKIFSINRPFNINGLKIIPVRTSHNVSSCGFVLGKFGIFTDTGIATTQMKKQIPKLNGILLESNHDIDMLINGPYPAFLKSWILSDKGHLSNIHAGSLIQKKGKNLSLALLGHLSANNNTPESAKATFEKLVKRGIDFEICSRDKESGSWRL